MNTRLAAKGTDSQSGPSHLYLMLVTSLAAFLLAIVVLTPPAQRYRAVATIRLVDKGVGESSGEVLSSAAIRGWILENVDSTTLPDTVSSDEFRQGLDVHFAGTKEQSWVWVTMSQKGRAATKSAMAGLSDSLLTQSPHFGGYKVAGISRDPVSAIGGRVERSTVCYAGLFAMICGTLAGWLLPLQKTQHLFQDLADVRQRTRIPVIGELGRVGENLSCQKRTSRFTLARRLLRTGEVALVFLVAAFAVQFTLGHPLSTEIGSDPLTAISQAFGQLMSK